MSLIEHLDGPGWRDFLGRIFATTLAVLEGDAHRWAGSSVDDLRTWLRTGGLGSARRRLDEQSTLRGFSDEHRAQIATAFDELIAQHRSRLVRLAVRGILVASTGETRPQVEFPRGTDVEECLLRIALGERPLDASMRAIGRSEAEIAAVYEIIDAWLATVLPINPGAN
jgi:hypothetical protein